MTVGELIKALQNEAPDAEVFVDTGEYEDIAVSVGRQLGGDVTLFLQGPVEESE